MTQALSDPSLVLKKLLSEKLISLGQAARLFPPSREGRPVSPSCVWRWHRIGVTTIDGRAVKLEAIWLVSRLVTSEEAVKRFIAEQQPQPTSHSATPEIVPTPASRSPAARQRDSEKAMRELQKLRK